MKLLTQLSHWGLNIACARSDKRFSGQCRQLQAVQTARLRQILAQAKDPQGHTWAASISDYAAFSQLPITRYADWQARIETMRAGGESLSTSAMVRFQPTSGSSQAIKFIPYTKSFLQELDAAIAPWIASLYRANAGLKNGVHYWSISWLPESQRTVLQGENLNDDSALLNFGKRLLSHYTQAVPSDVAFAANADDALFATLSYMLATERLSMISVWSPTFAISLFERMTLWQTELLQVLQTGSWGARAQSLTKVKAPHNAARATQLASLASNHQLTAANAWPQLAVVSSWDTASAKPWAAKLQSLLPHANSEGKGLWATEGVVTIPYNGKYPLAYHSHFYEFEDIETGVIKPSWELTLGDQVSPLISSSNGLLRYAMDDHIQVVDFMGQVPCFRFIGRRSGVDLVGEKMDHHVAQQVIDTISTAYAATVPLSLIAVDGQGERVSYYALLLETDATDHTLAEMAQSVERLLNTHFHYELARNLGQLAPLRIVATNDALAYYHRLCITAGMIEGNIKLEPLKKFSVAVFDSVQNTHNGQ